MDEAMATDYERLDGNAVAGLLQEVFGAEMTAVSCRCAHCGHVGQLGTLHAYTSAPGVVLRCSICQQVTLRIVVTPAGYHVDIRGAAYFRMPASD